MILVSGLYHGSACQAKEQVRNYFNFYENIVQVIHISADSYDEIRPALESSFKRELGERKLIINSSSIKTTSQSGLVGHFLNLECAKRILGKSNISHAYIHTSGDLLVKKGLSEYIVKNVLTYKDDETGSEITVIPSDNYEVTTMVDYETK